MTHRVVGDEWLSAGGARHDALFDALGQSALEEEENAEVDERLQRHEEDGTSDAGRVPRELIARVVGAEIAAVV